MRMFAKLTLSATPFYTSLLVVTLLGFFMGIFWIINEYRTYQETIENIRDNYQHRYEVRVKEELGKVIDLINYRRSQNDMQVERDIRERVQSAYTIASHIFRLYEDEKSVEELRSMVVEVLRPIRWKNGLGHYFSGRVSSGVIDLFADEPYFEKKTGDVFKELTGQDVIGDMVSIVRDKGAGLYRYNLVKPKFHGKKFRKTAFVKYFQPLDWFIGAAIYSDDLENILQKDVLTRLQNMKFGEDGEVFGFRFDGTILCSRDQRLIGRSIGDLVTDARTYGLSFWETGLSESREGYVAFPEKRDSDGTFRQKLSFVKAYDDWNWILGTSMYMDAMEQAIADETHTYQRITFKNSFIFIGFFLLAVVLLLFATFFYSVKIKEGINLFTDFFREAADSNVKIENETLAFREFEDLGRLANKMVEERMKNELLLHRNELRLDTLLRLGMMEKYSLQEKYDFVLQRIVQLTRSNAGYVAVVNSAQSHLTIRSFFALSDEEFRENIGHSGYSSCVEEAGLPGRAVTEKMTVTSNSFDGGINETLFPYQIAIKRHLDVPIYSDGKIVLVGGVCNNSEKYDNLDIRQTTMLLEGMWQHVLNKCSEEELEKLERQVIAVSEEERSKIGRDLHDDLGSHLTGVELLSKALQQKIGNQAPEIVEQFDSIRNLIRDAIDKTRRLSRGLYPVHVIEYGLESAVEELVVEVENSFNVKCTLSCESDGEEFRDNVATHLHYIVREAVFNAARHSKPETIRVFMKFRRYSFFIKIEDDGHGFGEKPDEAGLGFHTMKYRAKAIGATLTIDSDETSGTIVSVSGEVFE